MASNVQTLLSSLLLLATAVAAFDVKQILDPYTEFSTFTKYLTDTKLTDEINALQTVTVLVVDNSAVGPLASIPAAQLKDALSVHVLLDYYDPYIFDRNKTSLVTTLFQSSGRAADGNGFLNYTELPGERMMLGSAAPGAPHDSEILKVVGAKPYNLSVLQVSKAIVPPGIGGGGASKDPATISEKVVTSVPAPTASPATPAALPPKSSGAATPAAVPPKSSGAANPAAAPPKASSATPPKASSATPSAAPTKPSGAATPTAPTGPPKASAHAPETAPADGAAAPAASPAEGGTAPAEGPASSSASGPVATDAPTESDSTSAENADTPAPDAGEANAVSSAMRVAVSATMGIAMAVAIVALL